MCAIETLDTTSNNLAEKDDNVAMRPARMEDWGDVRDFCTHTFSWGDYIENVWEG